MSAGFSGILNFSLAGEYSSANEFKRSLGLQFKLLTRGLK